MRTQDLAMSSALITVGLIDEFIPHMFQVYRATALNPKSLIETMPDGDRVEAQHYLRLAEHLSRPITNKSMDSLRVCQHMVNIGLNPIEFILIGLQPSNPMVGKTARFIPTLPIGQFNGYEQSTQSDIEQACKLFFMPHTGSPTPTAGIVRHVEHDKVLAQDAALQKLLDCKAYTDRYCVGLPLSDPKARLFAVIFGSVKNVGYLAASPLLCECREAWFSELKHAPSDYQVGASRQFALVLASLESHELYHELNASLRTWVMVMAQGFADPDINIQTDSTALQIDKDAIGQLSFALDQLVELATLMVTTGNFTLTMSALKPLFEHPAECVEVFLASEISEDEVHQLFSRCLDNYLMKLPGSECITPASIQSLLDEYRQVFLAVGFSDIKGTKAMDGLAVHLDVAEGLEPLGYLRREEMQMGIFFALRFNQESDEDPDSSQSDQLLIRKMSLAMKLHQHETIAKAVDEFLSSLPDENLDLAKPASVLHYLESGAQPIESLLNTHQKIKRALAAGLKSSVILDCKALKRFHEDVLGRDLGL